MKILESTGMDRRKLLGGIMAGAAVSLSACTGMGGYSLTDAVRRLLFLSSERAFLRLTQDGGFWDQNVAALGLESFMGSRGNVLTRILSSNLFKARLEDAFVDVALEASDRAAPVVTDAVRLIGLQNAVDLVRGGPTAATSFLRNEMGGALVEAMVPEVGQALRLANEPLVGELLSGLTGVDVGGVANSFAGTVNNVIWNEIGREEAAIRANPSATRDPLIIGVFAAGNAF